MEQQVDKAQKLRSVFDILAIRSTTHADRVALLVDGVHSLTFGEWERRSNAVAHGLRNLGCRKRDRVGLLFTNSDWIDYAIAYVAALKIGAGTVHVSDCLPSEEVERRFDE